MSLVLSKSFGGLLLSSYVNIKLDLAIKSLQDLIDKPSVEIFYDNLFQMIQDDSDETAKLRKRIVEENSLSKKSTTDNNNIIKLRDDQAVIMCNSINCQIIEIRNPHLQLVYTDDHQFHTFQCYWIRKAHSHSKQISKV